ncbi:MULTISPECIES: DNA polymerase III subunit gamma/tau [Citromicrobium]|uniref:DNA polymerase III subunit gamma/tau n=1 Tax=Citromicrobium TaxID=72173 RepID=UPI0001DD0712|nr:MULTISPECIES: DNA polymerase III subunit gamma/tau [Citromicrobium]ALG61590.1 DNA polymerase III subunit gamma/tau [Citromicrobium sp. JL477]KPM13954.1 DNA polymerase III subunit gamma/tau [Citromicrobium sp. JL1351]KPM21006.1 DNA polymerase III subunit gamma/tau [Citromicrobium sp. JL31]KPM26991.1 DNA polymerase III subunit gamma/tau [Citromicrobium sp. JL2201]
MPDTDLPDSETEAPTAAELEAAGQSAMFGGEPAKPEPAPESGAAEAPPASVSPTVADPAQPYRVLARKYRPQTFSQLIGQEPMVQTLANAIRRDRLAHAFLMTGVRGVGKTSTARLIAKALNCIGPDGQGGPTIDPCGVCEPCRAIAEGRHIDVIEMDAASHTGVDDVREIIEAVRYAAVSARYKIYIIDEVHMLSRNAFNALLKTLEEPPAHVKFLFATTEVDKLPVTVLSRTQRFDLRRIPTERLGEHFAWVCGQEGVEAEPEALNLVAAAAEGSVRDGLSILDQAIAHADLDSDAKVTAARVRDMLGLADAGAQRRLLGAILEGEPKTMLDAVADQYALGVEPLALMRSLMEIVHRITVMQIGGAMPDLAGEEEREQLSQWAARLTPGQLHRLWQMLLRGYDEVNTAPDPLVSAQMALLRLIHAANAPDPGSLVKRMEELAKGIPAASADSPAPASDSGNSPEARTRPASLARPDFASLVAKVEDAGEYIAASIMRLQLRVVSLEDGALTFARAPEFRDKIETELRAALAKATGRSWVLTEVEDPAAPPSMAESAQAEAAALRDAMEAHPLMQAARAAFPQAELLDEKEQAAANNARQWSKQA